MVNPLLISSIWCFLPPCFFLHKHEKYITIGLLLSAFLYHRKNNCNSHPIILIDRSYARFYTIYSMVFGLFYPFKLLHLLYCGNLINFHRINKKVKKEGTNDGTLHKCKYHIWMHISGALGIWHRILIRHFFLQ